MAKFLFQKGHTTSEETRRKIGLANKGKHLGVIPKNILDGSLAASHRGVKRPPFSKEWRENIAKGKLGKHDGGVKKGNTPWNKGKKGVMPVGINHHMFGKHHTTDARIKIRLGNLKRNYRGENHWNWKGGITPINHKIRTSDEYKLWREAVFERDNWTCRFCKARSKKGKKVTLHADHIKPFALYPELRFAIDNGRTLCVDCHRKTDTWGRPNKLK